MKVLDYNFNKDYWDHNDSFSCVCNVKYVDHAGEIDWLYIDYWGSCQSLGVVSVAKDCEVIGGWDLEGEEVYKDNNAIIQMLFSYGVVGRFIDYIKQVDEDFSNLNSTKEIDYYFYGEYSI